MDGGVDSCSSRTPSEAKGEGRAVSPPKKFIQLCAVPPDVLNLAAGLYALDYDGRVHKYVGGARAWEQLPDTRLPPKEGSDE